MNPARFQSFAEAYAPAVLQAVRLLKVDRQGKTEEECALEIAMSMLGSVQTRGAGYLEGYAINTKGGALAATCATLGIEPTTKALERYLEG